MTRARDDGTEVVRRLAADLPPEAGVTEGRMFNGVGFQTGGKLFAFVNHTGGLMIKLPHQEARRLVEDGTAEAVTMGTRTMREWVTIEAPDDGDTTRWRSLLAAAHDFVAAVRDGRRS